MQMITSCTWHSSLWTIYCRADVAVNKIQRCMVEVKQRMVRNILKLNDDKRQFIVIGTRQQRSKIDILHIIINEAP